MPDSGSPKTERGVQPLFRKFSFFNDLLLVGGILAAHAYFVAIPNRADRPAAVAAVGFAPIRLDAGGFAPLKLIGAWTVTVADDRFGGVSALAVDQGRLLALTDSGTLISLPKPGRGAQGSVRDLPSGPGSAGFKRNRDGEALASDPGGRGWWVAFENTDQLWLYDRGFRTALARFDLGSKPWGVNQGVEAMVLAKNRMLLFPENGGQALVVGSGRLETRRLRNPFGRLSDAVRLPDGPVLLVGRKLGLAGFDNRLLRLDVDGMTVSRFASLGMRRRDNVEAIAAEPHAGGTRLWLMTDNDFRPRKATLLVALELP